MARPNQNSKSASQKSKSVSKPAVGKPPVPRRNDRAKSKSDLKAQGDRVRTRPADDETLNSLLVASLRERTFLRLTLSQQLAKSETAVSKVTVRPIEVGGQTKFQWTARTGSKELHENLTAEELIAAVDQYLHRAQSVVSVQHLAGHFGVGVMTTCTDQDAHKVIPCVARWRPGDHHRLNGGGDQYHCLKRRM